MNFKKLLSLFSILSLPVTMLTTTVSCTKNTSNLEIDFGIKGDIIKTANYILEDKVNYNYIMSYMEGFLNKAPLGMGPVSVNTYLNMKPAVLQQISLKNHEDPTIIFQNSSKFDNANLTQIDLYEFAWYGVAAEIATIEYDIEKPNQTELIIRLRDGTYNKWNDFDKDTTGKIAKWHDEVPVKAQDFVFTFECILNLENSSKQLQKIKDTKIDGIEEILEAQIKNKKSFEESLKIYNLGIKAVNENILYLKFNTPGGRVKDFKSIFAMISKFPFIPTREDFVKKIGRGSIKDGLKKFGSNKETILGNGAFFASFVMFDYETIFKKSDHYWDKERIPANCYKWKIVKDESTLGVLFKTNQIAQAYGISKDIYDEIQNDPKTSKYAYQGLDNDPIGTLLSINFNSKKFETKKAFQNVHFRRALATSINRTDVITASGADGTLPGETTSSLMVYETDRNGCAYKNWLVNDDGSEKYKLNFCDTKDKKYDISFATKNTAQQVFYHKSDLQIDFTDKLHNLNVVNYEMEKFKASFPLKKPIEINFLYNSTITKNQNAAEMIAQQLTTFIKKDIIKINLIGKEQNSFMDFFKKGDYDLALIEESISGFICSNSNFIFAGIDNMISPSTDDHFENVTGNWSLWEQVISKDAFKENDSDDGSGWASKILKTVNLEIDNNKKLTKDIFMSNDDVELLKWYFAKNKNNKSWFDTEMTKEFYEELVSTNQTTLDQNVFKKYFVEYNDKNKDIKFAKVNSSWKNSGLLALQFRAGRILEILIRYYQPIITLTSVGCSYDGCNLIGYTYDPHSCKYAYTDSMVNNGKLKNFKYGLPADSYYRSDMYSTKRGRK